MDLTQIGCLLQAYGADVLLLAAGVVLLTFLLKRTLLRKAPKKLLVVLPFLLGVVLYAVYRMIAAGSFSPITEDTAGIFDGGFSCGASATLYEVVFLQWTEGKKDPLLPLLKGFLPEDAAPTAAAKLLGEYDKEKGLPFVEETLKAFAPALSQRELEAYALLVQAYLEFLGK